MHGAEGLASPTSIRKARVATFALSVTTVTWGATFVWMKMAMESGTRVLGPGRVAVTVAVYLTLRFALAAILVWVCVPAARAPIGREGRRAAWRGGLALGLALSAGFILQLGGIEGVSPGVSAFLTSLYVPVTAALQRSIGARKSLPWPLLFGVSLATVGASIVGGPPQIGFGRGQMLTLLCAVAFAVHIVLTDRVTKRVAPMPVTVISFVVVAAVGLAMLSVTAHGVDRALLVDLVFERRFLAALILSAVLATAVALSLMNVFQRDLDPVRSAIIYAIEPIWATLIGIAAGYGHGDGWLWAGGALLLGGNLVAELGPRRGSLASG